MIRSPTIWSRRADDYEALLRRTQHRFATFYCREPKLRFASDQLAANPKRGISDFGPLEELKTRPIIRVGVVGTPQSIDAFSSYIDAIRRTVSAGANARDKLFDPLVFPDFPGTSSGVAYRVQILLESSHQRVVAPKHLEQDLAAPNVTDQIRNIVSRLGAELAVLGDVDPPPDVIAVVMPDFVQDACQHVGDAMRRRQLVRLTPGAAFARQMASLETRTAQTFFDFGFADAEPTTNSGYWNFHHALKARAMGASAPTQLIWERSLRGERTSQDPASIAWNLVTGFYYKAGNIPWEIDQFPTDTCFLGISFFKDGLHPGASTHTSLAQVFSGQGEGLVMKGGKAVKEPRKAAHMDQQVAQNLVGSALKLYAQHHPGAQARRLVVHKTSPFEPEEVVGVQNAIPAEMKLDLVSLKALSDLRFLRSGTHPPVRGTCIKLSDQETAVYTVGYIPEFRLYPGAKNPRPLLLRHEFGDSTRETICTELMALTKLNWNSCAYASREPITTLFASSVGSIMGEYLAIPESQRGQLQSKYRFYM